MVVVCWFVFGVYFVWVYYLLVCVGYVDYFVYFYVVMVFGVW